MNEETEGFLGGALSGASAGSVAGPYGALAGGVVGGVLGLSSARSRKKAEEAQKRRAEQLRVSSVLREFGIQQQRASMIQANTNRPGGSSTGSSAVQALDSSGFIGARLNSDIYQAPTNTNSSGTAGTF